MNLSDFIHTNIKKELLDLGHSSAVATSCADSARAEYDTGSNWKMGAVYAELSKKAKRTLVKLRKK